MPTRPLENWSSGGKVYFPRQSLTRLIVAQGIRPLGGQWRGKQSENIYRNVIKCRTHKMEMKGKEIENGPSRGGWKNHPQSASSRPCNNVLNTKSQNQTRAVFVGGLHEWVERWVHSWVGGWMRAEECLRRGLANGYKARVEKFRVPSLGKTANTHTHT